MALGGRQKQVIIRKKRILGKSITVSGCSLGWLKYRNETESAPNWKENHFKLPKF